MTIFEEWRDGDITDSQAIHGLAMHLGEVESSIAPLEAEKAALRDQLSHIVEHAGGAATIAGFGKLEVMAPSITRGYDKKRLDELLIALATEAPAVVARIAACRTESARAGSLRITREKGGR